MYKNYFKRLLDIIFSVFAFIILSPLLLAIAIIVRIKLGSPVIYRSKRIGKDNKEFTLYKFRTMTNERDETNKLLPDKDRLSKFGLKLRKLSFDELPELYNVVLGNMSLIGPRPLLPIYLPYYNKYEIQRHNVRPGLTGIAQINGRNGIPWEERFRYDVEYVKDLSFFLDIKIFLKTIVVVFKKENIIVPGTVIFGDFHIYRQNEKNRLT